MLKPLGTLFIIFFLNFGYIFAQNTTVILKFTDQFENPLIGVTVILKPINSANIQLSNFTDTTGRVEFKIDLNLDYSLLASSVGFKSFNKQMKFDGSLKFYSFELIEDSQTLESVIISAKKPLISQEDDKTIINPESIAETSTSALEILEKTPGLFVDQDGNVYLNSTTPAGIYINGREQKMSAADLASLLRSLPPNSIEKMEIMRTPSASQDAASSGGIVNIILKKGVKLGRTGTINSGFDQGQFGNQFLGVSLNRSLDTKSSFFSLNFSNRNSYQISTFDRLISGNERNLILENYTYNTNPSQSIFTSFGASIDLSKRLEVGYDARANLNLNKTFNDNSSDINTANVNAENVSKNTNSLQNATQGYTIAQGIFSKLKLDDKGSEWRTDISFNYFQNNGHQDYQTQFLFPNTNNIAGFGDWKNARTLFLAQTDLKYYFPKKVTLETGLKSSFQNFKNNTEYFKNENGFEKVDFFRTNGFTYFENINAAYLQASKTMGQFVVKFGTRIENTIMKGRQVVPSDTTFQINRTDLFPYLYLSRKVVTVAKKYQIRAFLIGRRTIFRPVYDYLNPFARFVDQYIYETGNPTLRPQFTNNFEANLSVMDMPILSFGRNYVQDIFSSVVYQDQDNPLISFRTYDNLGQNKETYFRLTAAIPPGGKYFFVFGSQYTRNQYEGILDSKPFTFDRGSWRFFTYHQLKLDDRSTLSMNGFLMAKGQMQFYELGNFGQLNFSLNRSFYKNKLRISAQLNDALFTNQNTFILNQGNISGSGSRRADTRRVGLNIRYSFGEKMKQENVNIFNVDGLEDK
jgi:iron complex outermembrane receptor protein